MTCGSFEGFIVTVLFGAMDPFRTNVPAEPFHCFVFLSSSSDGGLVLLIIKPIPSGVASPPIILSLRARLDPILDKYSYLCFFIYKLYSNRTER